MAADLKYPVTFRDEELNTVTYSGNVITGCMVDVFEDSEVDLRQFTEPYSLASGIDVGRVWKGARYARLSGTVYGSDRADAFARVQALEAVMLPEEGTFGLYDLIYYDVNGVGQIWRARPNGLRVVWDRRMFGGDASDPLAIPWTVTFLIASASLVYVPPPPPVFLSNWDYSTRDTNTSWQAYSDGSATDHTLTTTLGCTWNPNDQLRSRRYLSWIVPPNVRFASFTFTPSTGNNSSHSTETHVWEMRKCSFGAGAPSYGHADTQTLLASGSFPWNYDTLKSVSNFAVTPGDYLQLCMPGSITNPIGVSCTIRAGTGEFLGSWWT